MPWFKVDDKLHDHRKARQAGKAAMGVWVLAGSWAMDNLTDGFVPEAVLARWGTKADAGRLVSAGLWCVDQQDSERGWRFHDWARFQPSAAVTAAIKAKEAAAGARGNHKRWHVDRGITDPDCEFCHRVPDREPDGDPEAQPESGGESGATRPEPVPDPVSPNGESRAGKPPRARQLPEDFHPSEQHLDLAREQGVDLRAEWPQFVDHHRAKGTTLKDWDAGLRTWIRNAAKFRGRGSVVPLPAPRDPSGYAPDDLRNPNRRPQQ